MPSTPVREAGEEAGEGSPLDEAAPAQAAPAQAAPVEAVRTPIDAAAARERQKALVMRLRGQLEACGRGATAADTLPRFKQASARFVADGTADGAEAYLREFESLFAGALSAAAASAALSELGALLPSEPIRHIFDAARRRAPGPRRPPAPCVVPPSSEYAPPRPPMSTWGEVHSASTSGTADALGRAAAPGAAPRYVLASGPTYAAKPPTNLMSSARRAAAQQQAMAASTRRPAQRAALAPTAPRVTLAYAAAQQAAARQAAAARAGGVGVRSDGSSPLAPASASSASANASQSSAAAAAAAQFEDELLYGSAAALRAAMQYRR
jgi:hypothetical protein